MIGKYIGDALPRWVREGVRVKVKTNAITRRYGLQIVGRGFDRTWPGEVGVIHASQGNGWWDYRVEFPRGLRYVVDKKLLENLVRLRGQAPVRTARAFRKKSAAWFARGRDVIARGHARYTVVTAHSRLGRWVRSYAEAARVADLWRRNGLLNVRVVDDGGRTVYQARDARGRRRGRSRRRRS